MYHYLYTGCASNLGRWLGWPGPPDLRAGWARRGAGPLQAGLWDCAVKVNGSSFDPAYRRCSQQFLARLHSTADTEKDTAS